MPLEPGEVLSPSSTVVSPAELLKTFIEENADPAVIPGGVFVGGASDQGQQAGCIAIMDAGNTKQEEVAPLLWKRCQIRALAPSLKEADRIGNYAYELLHEQKWLELEDSLEVVWFVHQITMAAGPSHHLDSEETYESLSFATISVGSEPIGVPE